MKFKPIPTAHPDLQILDRGRKGILQLKDQVSVQGKTVAVKEFLAAKQFKGLGTPEKRLQLLVGKTDAHLNPLHRTGKGGFAVASSLKDLLRKTPGSPPRPTAPPHPESKSRPSAKESSVFFCKQGNGQRATISNEKTRDKLKQLAAKKGWTVYVTHGDRSKADEARLLAQGKAPARHSLHKSGKAADIVVYKKGSAGQEVRVRNREVTSAARKLGLTVIGHYKDGHLHVDTRRRMA